MSTPTFPRRDFPPLQHEQVKAALLREIAGSRRRRLPARLVVVASALALVLAVVGVALATHDLGRPQPTPATQETPPLPQPTVTGAMSNAFQQQRFLSVARTAPLLALAYGKHVAFADSSAQPNAGVAWSFTVPGVSLVAVALSPDGKLLVTVQADGTIRLWGVPADPLHTEPALLQTLGQEVAYLPDPSFSPDGRTVVIPGIGGRVGLFHVTSNRLSLYAWASTPGDGVVTGAAFAPDGVHLATTTLSQVSLWDLTRRSPQEPNRVLLTASFSALGPNAPKTLKVTSYGQHLASVAYSPDGHTLAVGAPNLQLWNVSDPVHPVAGAYVENGGQQVVFGPTGNRLATLKVAGEVAVYQLSASGTLTVVDTNHRKGSFGDLGVGPAGNLILAQQLLHSGSGYRAGHPGPGTTAASVAVSTDNTDLH